MSTLLAFDYGKRRIGVAVGNRITATASALSTITHSQEQSPWPAIAALLKEWKPAELVVGEPLHTDGTRQEFTDVVDGFAKKLAATSGLPVHRINEVLSSAEAAANLKWQRQAGRKRKVRKEEIDAQAARIILESWLQTV